MRLRWSQQHLCCPITTKMRRYHRKHRYGPKVGSNGVVQTMHHPALHHCHPTFKSTRSQHHHHQVMSQAQYIATHQVLSLVILQVPYPVMSQALFQVMFQVQYSVILQVIGHRRHPLWERIRHSMKRRYNWDWKHSTWSDIVAYNHGRMVTATIHPKY